MSLIILEQGLNRLANSENGTHFNTTSHGKYRVLCISETVFRDYDCARHYANEEASQS